MVQDWQEVIYHGAEACAMRDIHFQYTTKEMEYRSMLDANWTWIVNVERVEMALIGDNSGSDVGSECLMR